MTATQTNILFLVERLQRLRIVAESISQATERARKELQASEDAARKAWLDYQLAQNDLLVAAGCEDRSFVLGLE